MAEKNEKTAAKRASTSKEKTTASRRKKTDEPGDSTAKHAAPKKTVRAKKKAVPAGETAAAHEAGAESPAEKAKAPRKTATRAKARKAAAHAAPATETTSAHPAAEAPVAPAPAAPAPAKIEHRHEEKPPVKHEARHPAPHHAAPAVHKHEAHHHATHAAPQHPVTHAPAVPKEKPAVQAPAAAPVASVAPAAVQKPAPVPAPQAAAPAPAAPVVPAAPAAPAAPHYKATISINELVTVRELAEKMNLKAGDVLKKMIAMGSLASINQRLDTDTAIIIAHELGFDVKVESLYAEEPVAEEKEDPAKLKPRPPVVTIMGHVDHGKTSLLDAIRESRVAEGEAGGITQHIGAYKVQTAQGEVAFLDTPGHEAFTAMRSRGAQATDIVILVVSASDGVMPQTIEAIDHARAAGVPIIVAINKIDLPTANASQVKQELSKYSLVAEDWGGDTIMVEVSAKKKINIGQLLELVLLKAEMMELKANPDRLARGVVIESKLDARRGPVATVLVQSGTLHIGDNVVVGTTFGKIRAMTDEFGARHQEAAPSTPVELLGLNVPPQAGDVVVAVEMESQARQIADTRAQKARQDSLKPRHHLSLEDISQGKVKELRIILKTDVQGSLGALTDSLERLITSEINLKIIHRGVGAISESDVTLAAASDAMIIGFNIRPDATVERAAEHEGVSIRVYRIIYELIADVKAAMEGLLEPQTKETIVGKAAVKQVFKVSKVGTICGCTVTEGKIVRSGRIRLVRDNVIVYEGAIASLKRFKDDVREVEKGFECGIGLDNFSDIKTGDVMEVFTQEKVARKL